VLFSSLYYDALRDIAYTEKNLVAPRIVYTAVVNIFTVVGLMYFLFKETQRPSLTHGVTTGMIVGFLVVSLRAIMSAGLFPAYDTSVMVLDVIRGVLFGAVLGASLVGITTLFEKRSAAHRSAP